MLITKAHTRNFSNKYLLLTSLSTKRLKIILPLFNLLLVVPLNNYRKASVFLSSQTLYVVPSQLSQFYPATWTRNFLPLSPTWSIKSSSQLENLSLSWLSLFNFFTPPSCPPDLGDRKDLWWDCRNHHLIVLREKAPMILLSLRHWWGYTHWWGGHHL